MQLATRKRVGRFFKGAVLGLVITFGMIYFFQEKLIFYSKTLPQTYEYPFEREFEELFLTAPDGAVLNGLHFKVENPKGIILYNHGNAGNLDSWGGWGEALSQRYGYEVVLWDYRGYGKSTGKRRTTLMLDDGLLFYTYCRERFPEDAITVYGRSLGGFFATHITKNNTPEQLVLESTPTSLLEVAQEAYPFLPAKWLLRFRFQNIDNMPHIDTPTFLIHGTADDLVPFDQGERLYEQSRAPVKRFFPIRDGNHNDLSYFEGPYFGALREIFEK